MSRADRPYPWHACSAAVELLEWLRDKKQLKSMKGGKQLWGPANLEQERHRAGEFPRIGAFEVYILSSASGPKGSTCLVHEAYSKLHHGRWPTVPLLVSKICKTLGRIKKRENMMPRCSTIWLNSIGKLFDVHGHPPSMTTGQLLIPSLRCWVHPEVEGELLSAEFKPHDVEEPLQLCDVTPGMRLRSINLRHCDIKYSVAKEVAHFVSKASSLQSLSLRDNDIGLAHGVPSHPVLWACRSLCFPRLLPPHWKPRLLLKRVGPRTHAYTHKQTAWALRASPMLWS